MGNSVKILRSSESDRQLIMLPFAGGHGRSYAEFLKYFKGDFEVIGIDPPGSFTQKAERINRVDKLAEKYIDDLKPVLKKEIVIFGHSMGATVAYELIRKLSNELRSRIVHVVLSGAYHPEVRIKDDDDLHSAMDDGQLIAKCVEIGGFPVQLKNEPEFCSMFCRMMRSDLEALETYRIPLDRESLGISATVCRGSDEKMSSEDKEKWKELFSIRDYLEFEGNHFFIFGKHMPDICMLIEKKFRSAND